jgi:hypothetical protein
MSTTTHPVVPLSPLLGDAGAASIVELCERFARYGMYSQEHVESDIGRGLPQRYDAARNFVRTGGRFARDEPAAMLAARTNYFREEYAYGLRGLIDGIDAFLHHEGFVDAARQLFDRPVIEPAIVFANLMVPGQELAVHTDVPEFRGCNRKVMPQWLLVAMHHSKLFDEWRMPIATGVAWFHDCPTGGEFAYWPDGAGADPVAHTVRADTALVLDADSVFHGVDRVASATTGIAPLKPGMALEFAGGGEWAVRDGNRDDGGDGGAADVTRYRWDELRFSVSWKAYCFENEAEQTAWRDHVDDLSIETVVDRFIVDLKERGRLDDGPVTVGPDLGQLIIDEYIKFPSAS